MHPHHTRIGHATLPGIFMNTDISSENSALAVNQYVAQLSSLPIDERVSLWNSLSRTQQVELLPMLPAGIYQSIVDETSSEALISLASNLEVRDAAELIDHLDTDRAAIVLVDLTPDTTESINQRLDYPAKSAMRWMSPAISIRPDWTLNEAATYLRRHHDVLPPFTTSIMVTTENEVFQGKFPLSALILHPGTDQVQTYMVTEAIQLPEEATETDIVQVFEDRRLVSVPVVGAEGKLLGRVTIEDALELNKKLADDQFMKSAGLDHETDLFSPRAVSFKRRSVWLAINLLTVFFAAAVISVFQETVQKVVALAVLMPIFTSMGGISGSQTLTLIIRGLSQDHINRSNMRWILNKEIGVGLLHGVTWAVVVGVITVIWFKSLLLGVIIGLALLINMICAAASGVVVPLVLRRFGQDPALAGSVLLTTVTDVIGFFAFLGLASLWMT